MQSYKRRFNNMGGGIDSDVEYISNKIITMSEDIAEIKEALVSLDRNVARIVDILEAGSDE
jgi:hypothetical protein